MNIRTEFFYCDLAFVHLNLRYYFYNVETSYTGRFFFEEGGIPITKKKIVSSGSLRVN